MAWTTDGHVTSAAKSLGANEAIGVGPIPIWGKGKLATSYDTTQSSAAFITKWSKHPKAAAQFLTFLHTPQALKAWYAATGVFPADKRFPASLVTSRSPRSSWRSTSRRSRSGPRTSFRRRSTATPTSRR